MTSATIAANAGASNITLTEATNDFGTVLLTGDTVQVTDTNSIDLGASTIATALTVNAGGNVTQSGAIAAAGAVTTTVNANGSDITLLDAANDFGTVALDGSIVLVNDTNGIDLGASSISTSFEVNAGGNVTNSGVYGHSQEVKIKTTLMEVVK